MTLDTSNLFLKDPLTDLDALLQEGVSRRASRLLILAGKPVVLRIEGKLSPPLTQEKLHFRQMESLANALLSPEQIAELDKGGAVEIEYKPANAALKPVNLNVFFGDGSHNVVVFLTASR